MSSRLFQKVFFSWINAQKHAGHIQIFPTLDVFPQFQVKQMNFDINESTEFLSSEMSKFLKH